MKKKLLMAVSYVLILALGVMGTVAYFTDRDAEVNVFTVGNVDIELNEDFRQGAELLPGKEVEKKVSITNTGKNDAWVWYTIAYPKALDLTTSGKTILWTGFTTENHDNAGYAGANDGVDEWYIEYADEPYLRYYTDANNVEMVEFTVLYQDKLGVNETTPGSLECLYLDKSIDMDPDGNLYYVKNGTVEAIDWNVKTNGTPKVYVAAYAIQTENFTTVWDAYAAYGKQWGANGGVEYVEPVVAENEEELKAALTTAGNRVALTAETYDFNGATVALADGVTVIGNGAEVENVLFTVANKQSAAFEDVTFDGTTTIQALANGSLSLKDCKINIAPNKYSGFSRGAAIIGSNQYNTLDLYLDGCTFNYEESPADRYNAAIFMWSSVRNVEIKNCTFNGYGFVAVKLMNAVEGANILFEGNTFNMSAKGSANYWYNCAVQLVPQHDHAMNVVFKNNAFNGGYQTGGDLADEFGYATDNTNSIVAEIAVMHYTSLTKLNFKQEGNTVNGVAATADNFALEVN